MLMKIHPIGWKERDEKLRTYFVLYNIEKNVLMSFVISNSLFCP